MNTPALPLVSLDELTNLSRRASTVIERLRERVFAPGTQKELDLRFNVRTAAERHVQVGMLLVLHKPRYPFQYC